LVSVREVAAEWAESLESVAVVGEVTDRVRWAVGLVVEVEEIVWIKGAPVVVGDDAAGSRWLWCWFW
jgi:hypothetical protein